VASWTHTISPTFFSETLFTAGVEDMAIFNIGDDKKWSDTLGLPNPFNEYGSPYRHRRRHDVSNPDNRRNNISCFNIDENLTASRRRVPVRRALLFRSSHPSDQQQPQGPRVRRSCHGLRPASGSTYGAVPRTGHPWRTCFWV
jgi:hypothetical protein